MDHIISKRKTFSLQSFKSEEYEAKSLEKYQHNIIFFEDLKLNNLENSEKDHLDSLD